MAVYSDIDIELTQSNDGDILRDTDEEAVINSVTNIINTYKGSRRMLPDFATSIERILFEPIDDSTANLIKSKLVDNINRWDDRVVMEAIYVTPYYDENMYKCLLSFSIKGFKGGTREIRWVIRRD
jgi:phage baseplate assembly protein W